MWIETAWGGVGRRGIVGDTARPRGAFVSSNRAPFRRVLATGSRPTTAAALGRLRNAATWR